MPGYNERPINRTLLCDDETQTITEME